MKKIKLIAGACFLSVAIAGVAVGTTLANREKAVAQAYEATTAETVESSYEYGAEFVVPAATIAYKGEDIPATKSVLVYPSGAIFEGGTHVLQEEGEYTIIYYATVSGKNISAEVSFQVGKTKTIDEETTNIVLDTTAPVLTVHEGFKGDVEHKVAIGETVAIPKATATDEHLKGEPTALVYYHYGTEKQSVINVAGGQFTPQKAGQYTIVYSASDTFGNVTEEIVHISCGEATGNVAATLSATNATGEAGDYVTIPQCAVEGLYDDISLVKVYAQFEGATEREEIKDYRYFPRNVGAYQIVYELATPFKTYSATGTLTTSAAGNSEIGKAYIPEYFIKGYSYSLDDVEGYLFNGAQPERKAAQAYVKQDGGDYAEIDHKDFKITASSTVQFKFTCGESVVETETAKVVDVGVESKVLKVENYFLDASGSLTAGATTSDVRYTIENGAGDYALDFVNVLSLSSFKLDFTVPSQDKDTNALYNEMEAVEVVVTDYYDRSNQVVVRYENNGGTLTLSLGGGKKTTVTRSFTGTKNSFAYSNDTFLDSTSGTEFAWDGAFTSDKVLLSLRLVGVEGGAGIAVSAVGKQSLNSRTTTDSIAPTVYVENMQKGIRELNSVATLNAAQVTDVLTPYLEKKLSLTVTDPQENFVTSVDGALLDGTCDVTIAHKIKLESYGDYIVTYTYYDQYNNIMTIRYAINVPERVAPTITLKGVNEYEIVNAALGTKVKIADYEIADETTAKEALRSYVYVSSPDVTSVALDENGYFNATSKGDYTVMYTCYDEEGNFALVTYTVRVA